MNRIRLKGRLSTWLRTASGMQAWAERRLQGVAILVYHGIVQQIRNPFLDTYCVDVPTFERHLRFFEQNLCPVSLPDLLDAIKSGDSVDSSWVCITFDDALESQCTLVANILGDHDIPWALSVPAALVGTNRSVWTYELSFLLMKCWRETVIQMPLNPSCTLPVETKAQKQEAVQVIKNLLIHKVQNGDRMSYIEGLIDRIGRTEFLDRLKEYGVFSMANWDNLRTLANSRVTMISHGLSHLPFNDTLSTKELLEETEGSRRKMKEELGFEPEGLALPGGIVEERSLHAVKDAGYRFCLTSITGRAGRDTSILYLPRIDAEYPLGVLRRHMLAEVLVPDQPQML